MAERKAALELALEELEEKNTAVASGKKKVQSVKMKVARQHKTQSCCAKKEAKEAEALAVVGCFVLRR